MSIENGNECVFATFKARAALDDIWFRIIVNSPITTSVMSLDIYYFIVLETVSNGQYVRKYYLALASALLLMSNHYTNYFGII